MLHIESESQCFSLGLENKLLMAALRPTQHIRFARTGTLAPPSAHFAFASAKRRVCLNVRRKGDHK